MHPLNDYPLIMLICLINGDMAPGLLLVSFFSFFFSSIHATYVAYNVSSLHVLLMLRHLIQAKEYFEKAAENDESGGHYNLGVMYLKGIGVKRDVKKACTHFIMAANAGQPKAFYQLAKMFHTGVGLKRNIPMVNSLNYIS